MLNHKELQDGGHETDGVGPLTVSIPEHSQCLLNSVQEELQDGGNNVEDAEGIGGHPALSQCPFLRMRNA